MMTSAEFAATYRVLKTLTERGARSQIAQEVALGRMVMVHHLDVGSAIERQRLRAGVGALQPSASAQVFAVYDVDGATVVVTHFLTTFTDFPSWLRDNAMPDDASTVVISSMPRRPDAAPTLAPPGPASPPASSFTAMFGAVKPAAAPPAGERPASPATERPATPAPAHGAAQPGEFTRQFQKVNPPAGQAVPRSAPSASPPPTPTPPHGKGGESFTQLFGGMASPLPATPATPPAAPFAPSAPRFGSVIPPQDPEPPRVQPSTPPSSPLSPPPKTPSGEFTQLFDRLTPSVPLPTTPRPAAAPVQPPAAPPAAPSPSWSQPAPSAKGAPPSPSWQAAPPAPQHLPNAATPADAGPSEFTRILGRVSPPPTPQTPSALQMPGGQPTGPSFQMPQAPQMPQMPQAPQMNLPAMQLPPMQLPQAQLPAAAMTPLNVPRQSEVVASGPTRSHLPLIIALNVVLIGAIGVVLYFVLRH
ncbi:MAG: hypothetical protein ABJA80_07415 [bacterium]